MRYKSSRDAKARKDYEEARARFEAMIDKAIDEANPGGPAGLELPHFVHKFSGLLEEVTDKYEKIGGFKVTSSKTGNTTILSFK